MASRKVVESSIVLIRDYLKANMPQALIDVRTDRVDGAVTTEPPKNYFIYTPASGYQAPAVFVVAESVDFKLNRGQNHVNATVRVLCSVVVEDKDAEKLEIKLFRYHDAIHHLLDNLHLDDTAHELRCIVKVVTSDFGQGLRTQSAIETIFRKEVMFTLEVEHYEKGI
jgi:hypothetical protein